MTPVARPADSEVFKAPRAGANAIDPPAPAYQTLSNVRAEALALVRGEVEAIFAPGHYGVPLRAFIGAELRSRPIAPIDSMTDALRRDYENTTVMIFGTPPRLDEILASAKANRRAR